MNFPLISKKLLLIRHLAIIASLAVLAHSSSAFAADGQPGGDFSGATGGTGGTGGGPDGTNGGNGGTGGNGSSGSGPNGGTGGSPFVSAGGGGISGGGGGGYGGGSGGGGGGGGGGTGVTTAGGGAVTSVSGGNGGKGGNGQGSIVSDSSSGGGGGGGGIGANLSAGTFTIASGNTIQGGSGGNGGDAALVISGSGGAGAYGIELTGATLTNNGTVIGGNGGAAGDAFGSNVGSNGPGGAGFSASSSIIINNGTITGGSNGGGGSQVNAITFTSGVNTLEIESASVINGNVVTSGANQTLELGGTVNGTFDVSTIGTQYTGFTNYNKIGSSTYTLTNTTTTVTPWNIEAGILEVTQDSNLGAASGGVTLAGGELLTNAGGGFTTSRTVALNTSGTIAAVTGTTATYNGAISGAGGTVTIGDVSGSNNGTVVFATANNYSGGTTVTSGTLAAANVTAFGSGSMSVQGGTLQMANGNRTVTIGGTYAQGGGGILALTVDNTTADQVNVTLTAGLGGTLSLNLSGVSPGAGAPGSMGTTKTYTLLTSSGLSNTKFSTVDYVAPPAADTETVSYTTDDVLLNVTSAAVLFPTMGNLTPNQQAILGPINNSLSMGNMSPAFLALDTALANAYAANPGGFGSVLNELSPQAFGQFTSETAFNNASFETEAMDNYLANQRDANGNFLAGNGGIDSSGLTVNDPSYDPNLAMVHSRLLAWNPAPYGGIVSDVTNPVLGGMDMKDSKEMASVLSHNDPWNFFVRGNVILAQGFSNADTGHFDDNTESVVLGADYRFTPNFLFGLTAGYAHTDVTLDDNGSSATVDSYSPGFYASYADKGWYANLSGDYLHNAYTQSRNIAFLGQTANSAPEGNEGVANLDGGYDFHSGALTFGPLAGVQYTHLSVDGYNETGSIADLSVNDSESDSLRSRVGGRISYALMQSGIKFTPHLDATYQHEFLDQGRGITSQFNSFGGGSFSIRTINPSRDSALADAGFNMDINGTVTVFTDYIVQAGQNNYFGQSVQAGIKIGF